jgi:branched-chain amino acid transport system permease protein
VRRSFPSSLLAGLVAIAVLLIARPALAQPESTPRISGILTVAKDGKQQPVAGVKVTVLQGPKAVGSDRSARDGRWEVAVPAAGTYRVRIDTATLPEGVRLAQEGRDTLERVELLEGFARKVVLFPLTAGGAAGGGSNIVDRLADLAANGVKVGLIVALAAIGLSIIFGVTGLVNFAHGELVTFGAVVAWWLSSSSGGPGLTLILATIVAVVLGGVLGGTLEVGLWRPLRRRRLTNISLMVVSIGLSLLMRNAILLVFGGAPRKYLDYAVQRSLHLGPVNILPKDVVIMVIAAVVLVAVGVGLKTTRIGTAMRAVSDNRDLAAASGIDVQRVILITWVIGSALAGLGGVLYGTSQTVSWNMGFSLLLIMFAAVILGGLGSAYGAMAGGLVIGLVSELSTYWLPLEFKLISALVVLIVVLLVRPQGILGVRERIG